MASRPNYTDEAVEIDRTVSRQRPRAIRLAMDRAFNDGLLHAAGLCVSHGPAYAACADKPIPVPCDKPTEAGQFYADLIFKEFKK